MLMPANKTDKNTAMKITKLVAWRPSKNRSVKCKGCGKFAVS